MIKLALLGKDISHSKSGEIYERLLNKKISYSLLDCLNREEIPSLKNLFDEYDGVNITSPYKTVFFDSVKVPTEIASLGGINCLKCENEDFFGTNTDYFALKEIIQGYINEISNIYFIILGDGVMSKVTQKILKQENQGFEIVSRKTFPLISEYVPGEELLNKYDKVILFNACSRGFIYNGNLSSKVIFYDYNYIFSPHIDHFSDQKCTYIDGIDLLEKQACYALDFMNIKK